MKTSGVVNFVIVLAVLLLLFLLWVAHGDHRPDRPYVIEKAQLNAIGAALAMFTSESGGLPPSNAADEDNRPYCGAMKLCEALMGQDLLGFNRNSRFRLDGRSEPGGNLLYTSETLKTRRGPFLPHDWASAHKLVDIYGKGKTGPFPEHVLVLCDTYERRLRTGIKAGMPLLYYRANTSLTAHDVNDRNNPENIYDYRDNHALLGLGVPGQPDRKHPLFADPRLFYRMARSAKVPNARRPSRADSFILISAGLDGLYGTQDDVTNVPR